MTTPTRRRFVEQFWTIEVSDFMANPNIHGYITWQDQFTGEEIAGVDYSLALVGDDLAVLWLQFDLDGNTIRQEIPMVPTRPNFGGKRWWFTCLMEAGERTCGRRARKLYLPRRESLFGCEDPDGTAGVTEWKLNWTPPIDGRKGLRVDAADMGASLFVIFNGLRLIRSSH